MHVAYHPTSFLLSAARRTSSVTSALKSPKSRASPRAHPSWSVVQITCSRPSARACQSRRLPHQIGRSGRHPRGQRQDCLSTKRLYLDAHPVPGQWLPNGSWRPAEVSFAGFQHLTGAPESSTTRRMPRTSTSRGDSLPSLFFGREEPCSRSASPRRLPRGSTWATDRNTFSFDS